MYKINFMKKALKEWNTTVETLGKGKIIAIWRKGGINETFFVPEKRFLLFPTFTHQNLDKIKKEYWEYFNHNHKFEKENQIQIKYWAEVYDEITIEKPEQLQIVTNELIYTEDYINDAINTFPNEKGKLLLLRTYSLLYPVLIPLATEYGGCKSWLDLNIDIPRIKSTPSLNFKDFSQKAKYIKSTLLQTVPTKVQEPTLVGS